MSVCAPSTCRPGRGLNPAYAARCVHVRAQTCTSLSRFGGGGSSSGTPPPPPLSVKLEHGTLKQQIVRRRFFSLCSPPCLTPAKPPLLSAANILFIHVSSISSSAFLPVSIALHLSAAACLRFVSFALSYFSLPLSLSLTRLHVACNNTTVTLRTA
ncbi:hypothetical protein SprV_0200892700 [Sparganum proliferum]